MNNQVFAEDYLRYQTNRSWLRKQVRKIYIWHTKRHLVGKVIDFGCGIGEHLESFGEGSVGLEVNRASVEYCNRIGLDVRLYDPAFDDYELKEFEHGQFNSLVISHVLEHIESPEVVFKKLLTASSRLGLKRVYVCVPGELGYKHDATHITFIDKKFIEDHGLKHYAGFKLVKQGYFPINAAWFGKYFTHNEMYLVYDRVL
jgi:hypothetical protein